MFTVSGRGRGTLSLDRQVYQPDATAMSTVTAAPFLVELVKKLSTASVTSNLSGIITRIQAYADNVTVGDSWTAIRVLSASFISSLSAASALTGLGSYTETMMSDLLAHAFVTGNTLLPPVTPGDPPIVGPPIDADSQTWVVNTETKATSQFDNYSFNSYAYDAVGGVYLGAMDDGVYELDGTNDAGLPLISLVQLPKTDFALASLKRIPNIWIGCTSDNKLIVKVEADGLINYYQARTNNADPGDLKNVRVDLGRGLRANYWGFTIMSDKSFDIASVHFLPLIQQRRTG